MKDISVHIETWQEKDGAVVSFVVKKNGSFVARFPSSNEANGYADKLRALYYSRASRDR